MRTTISIEDELVEEAIQATGITERAALLRAGLRSLIQNEAARRLILLGGSQPDLEDIPRRRPA